MNSGPVVAMVWEGLDAVKQGRAMLGATNPLQSNAGTIRGKINCSVYRKKLTIKIELQFLWKIEKAFLYENFGLKNMEKF
jgi:nucleoside diphosphate kinase